MKFQLYDNTSSFGKDTLGILLEQEVQNNLLVGFIRNDLECDTAKWLMSTIKDEDGNVLLTAACTPPFNIVLFETANRPNNAAVQCLSNELKALGFVMPGVLAERGLAARFAEAHVGPSAFHRHLSMNIMRLDKVNGLPRASGRCRPLCEDDLFYIPYWERAFGEECRVEYYDILTHVDQLKKRIGKDTHYIWEDGVPVSQVVHGRSTENGAVINGVYTPPHYRGRGYASAAVATLSQLLLDRGNKFCCLFADADNPISCGIYRKLGFVDQCVYDDLAFQVPKD